MSEGVIYILVNEAMPNIVKIGKTTTSVEQRMRELDTTGIPLPFECYYAARVDKMDSVERNLHDAFDDKRIRKRREFFEIDPARNRSALFLSGGEDDTPRDDVVEDTALTFKDIREEFGDSVTCMVEALTKLPRVHDSNGRFFDYDFNFIIYKNDRKN